MQLASQEREGGRKVGGGGGEREREREGGRGGEGGNGTEEIFEEIMAKNFPKLMTDIKPQIQEDQRILSRINN